jgi:hypothetical protein
VAGFTRLGISVWGSRILEVRGRKSGEPRRTPVNMLTFDGQTYLVAPRGHTQWVRNLRAAGEGDLLLGRKREGPPDLPHRAQLGTFRSLCNRAKMTNRCVAE